MSNNLKVNKCNYCELGERNQPIMQNSDSLNEIWLFISESNMVLEKEEDRIRGLVGDEIQINYCPKCGRKLDSKIESG